MKIRFFNTVEPVTTFYRDLLPFLANKGFKIEVYISGIRYRFGRKSISDVLRHPNIRIVRVTPRGIVPRGRLSKLGDMLSYMVSSAAYSLRNKSHLSYFLTQPPMFSLWGWVLKVAYHQPYICMVMDLYPDVAVNDGLLNSGGLLTSILRRLSRFALKHADAVVTIGRCTAEILESDGIEASRIYVIRNWADERLIYPVSPEENMVRKEWGFTPEDFVVLYSGNMGVSHDFDSILRVADRMKNERRIKFVFVGNGVRYHQIEQAERKFPNVFLFPFQPQDNLANSLSVGDVHFVSLRTGFEGLVVPSKTYGSLAAGRPVIYQGHPKSEIARTIKIFNVGVVIDPDDVEGLEEAVRTYYVDASIRKTQGRRAREVAQQELGRERALRRYLELFRKFEK